MSDRSVMTKVDAQTRTIGWFAALFFWLCLLAIFGSITFAICYTIIERVL